MGYSDPDAHFPGATFKDGPAEPRDPQPEKSEIRPFVEEDPIDF